MGRKISQCDSRQWLQRDWEYVCPGKSPGRRDIRQTLSGFRLSPMACVFVSDTAHRRYDNTKLIYNSAIINPLSDEIRGQCYLKDSYLMVRGGNWLQSFAKLGRESRKFAINSGSNLPPATRLFLGLLCYLCLHRRVCVVSLTAWSSWGKQSLENC